MRGITVLKENLVYHNRYGSLFDDEVSFPSGEVGTYLRWQWETSFSVAVLPIDVQGKVHLVQPFRHAARGFVTEAPKGFSEDGKSPLEQAAQELQEELGLHSTRIICVGEGTCDPGFVNHPMYLFIAYGCVEGPSAPESTEVFGPPVIIELDNVFKLQKDGVLRDMTTLTLLWTAAYLSQSQGV